MTRAEFVRRWARGEAAMADDLTALLNAERDLYAAGIAELVKQRDEAHARAEKAKRERDEARAEAKESAASDMDSLQRLRAVEPALERARVERDDAERARDEWKARAEKAESALLNVHDALHAECDGSADLAAEVRALRARADKAEAERDEARAALLSSAHAQREACAKMVGAHMRLPIAPEAEMLVRSTPLVTPRSPTEPTKSSLTQPKSDTGDR